MILSSILLAAAVSASAAPSNAEIVTHIRETFGIPPQVQIELSPEEPSGLPGLSSSTMSITSGEQTQKQTVYFLKDGRHYFMADIHDLNKDPDGSRRALIRMDGAMSRGPADAKVTVVEYSDFECPYCKQAQQSLEKELGAYKDNVRVVFKTFPLTSIHPWAMNAAIAARCAGRQKPDAFWNFADGFFGAQKEITPDTVKAKALDLAGKAGLDRTAFEACYDKAETADLVKADQAEGDKLGVNSTPSFFINGHPIRGYPGFEPFKQLIDEMLAGKHPAKG